MFYILLIISQLCHLLRKGNDNIHNDERSFQHIISLDSFPLATGTFKALVTSELVQRLHVGEIYDRPKWARGEGLTSMLL